MKKVLALLLVSAVMLGACGSNAKGSSSSKKSDLVSEYSSVYVTDLETLDYTFWNGNSFFDKFYKVQNFFPYAIPIVLDNEPPRM